jgi:hypothetical protein
LAELVRCENAASEDELTEKAQKAHAAPFDFKRGPLLRITLVTAPEKLLAMVTTHHLVADGWSMGLLAEAIAGALEGKPALSFERGFSGAVDGIAAGNESGLAELEQMLERDACGARKVQGLWAVSRAMDMAGDEVIRVATAEEEEKVMAAARHARRTLAAHLFGSYCAALAEAFSLQNFICLTNSVGPRASRAARTVGYFSNVVPVPVRFAHGGFEAGLDHAVAQFEKYRKHKNVEFGAVLDTPIGRELRRDGAIASFCFMQQKFKRLNGLALSLTGLPTQGAEFAGLPLGSWHLTQQCGQFPVALEYIEVGQRFCGVAVKYRTRVVERSVVERLADRAIAYACGA